MCLKINKENEKHTILHASKQQKQKNYGNSAILTSTLSHNNKILKMRRNSNFMASTSAANCQKLWQQKSKTSRNTDVIVNTLYTRRISLLDCTLKYNNNQSIRNKTAKIVNRSTTSKDNSTLYQSNISGLKLQAAKLDGDFIRYSQTPYRYESIQNKEELDTTSFKPQTHRKSNMRKIIKGRPKIASILQQNRNRILQWNNNQNCWNQQCSDNFKVPQKNESIKQNMPKPTAKYSRKLRNQNTTALRQYTRKKRQNTHKIYKSSKQIKIDAQQQNVNSIKTSFYEKQALSLVSQTGQQYQIHTIY